MLAVIALATLYQLPGTPVAPLESVRIDVKFIGASKPIAWKQLPGQPLKIENPPAETPFQAYIVNGTADNFMGSFEERGVEENRPEFKVLSAPVLKSLPGMSAWIAQQKDRETAHAIQVIVSQNAKSPTMLDVSVSYSPKKRAQDSEPWPFARTFTVSPAQTVVLAIAPPEGKDLATYSQVITVQATPNPSQAGG